MLTSFGKILRKIRIDHNEFLKDMADKLDVTVSYLSAIEHGKREVPNGWVNEIGELYNLSKQEINELDTALYESKKELFFNLSNLNDSKRKVAIAFAREFDDFSDEQISDMLNILKKMKGEWFNGWFLQSGTII